MDSLFCKWNGYSNFQSKLLAPSMHDFMNKEKEKEKLIYRGYFEIGVNQSFVPGQGQDQSAKEYVFGNSRSEVKTIVERRCAFLCTDGDGHCLLHSISKSLVGSEILWFHLRIKLVELLRNHKPEMLLLLHLFDFKKEYEQIVLEASPEYYDPRGMRLVHLFGLANVLRRPIILFDKTPSQKEAGIYLPLLYKPDECYSKYPLVIAWSGENHFVSVVPKELQSRLIPLECLPLNEEGLPNVWSVTENVYEVLDKYIGIISSEEIQGLTGLYFYMGGHQLNDVGAITSTLDQSFKSTYGLSTNYLCEVAKALITIPEYQEWVFMFKMEQIFECASILKDDLKYCSTCIRNVMRRCIDPFCDTRNYNHESDRFEYRIGDCMPPWSDPKDGRIKYYCEDLRGRPIMV